MQLGGEERKKLSKFKRANLRPRVYHRISSFPNSDSHRLPVWDKPKFVGFTCPSIFPLYHHCLFIIFYNYPQFCWSYKYINQHFQISWIHAGSSSNCKPRILIVTFSIFVLEYNPNPTNIWAAVKINCLCLVQKYKLSLFGGGPIAFQCFVQINTKYCKNARELASRIQI